MNEPSLNELFIRGLTMDSRRVKPGDLFFAITGSNFDGRDFIEEAIARGAIAVLFDPSPPLKSPLLQGDRGHGIPIVSVPNLKNIMGSIAARFFEEPSHTMSVIGITGTNGKTSCSHFIAQILAYCESPCGIMGTLGVGFLENLQRTNYTTIDSIATQAALANFRNQGTKVVAMEVTSHALTQGRVAGVRFQTAVFTNLTQDHLDYHKNMQRYGEAKKSLFTDFHPKYSIINAEDEFGLKLMQDPAVRHGRMIGYTTQEMPSKDLANSDIITTHDLVLDAQGMRAFIHTPWGEGELHCSLLGRFNLSNVLASIAAVCMQDIPFKRVLEAVSYLKTVPGRMMRLGGTPGALTVVIDYAHTPDALMQVLKALRAHCRGQLWCVFGCGGDRDRGKRPLMASVVEALSDRIIMTQDNPRTEDPKQIFDDMLHGLQNPERARIVYDRRKAIQDAIASAAPNDLVVIAGKGHETDQIIGTEKFPFCDLKEANVALESRSR